MRALSAAFLALLLVVVGCVAPTEPDADSETDVANADPALGDVGDEGALEDHAIPPADESVDEAPVALGATVLETSANLNLRKGAGAEYEVLTLIPKGSVVNVLAPTPQNGFLHIAWNGTSGYGHSAYLVASGTTTAPPVSVSIDGPASPDNAILRSQSAVGFSYWWGGGRWLASGATSSNRGTCSGSCPSCTHAGSYGADCSGLVAKAWQLGEKSLSVNSHPYSTVSFAQDAAGKWSTVSRGAMKRGDALVYNSDGHGHIAIYEKGDGWGSPTVYECRGCSYGCVHNTRSFGSNYHAIRRAGF